MTGSLGQHPGPLALLGTTERCCLVAGAREPGQYSMGYIPPGKLEPEQSQQGRERRLAWSFSTVAGIWGQSSVLWIIGLAVFMQGGSRRLWSEPLKIIPLYAILLAPLRAQNAKWTPALAVYTKLSNPKHANTHP